jgi:hypothetical protein
MRQSQVGNTVWLYRQTHLLYQSEKRRCASRGQTAVSYVHVPNARFGCQGTRKVTAYTEATERCPVDGGGGLATTLCLLLISPSDLWGRAIAQAVSPRRPGLELGSSNVGFVVDRVELGQVFSEFVGFSYKFSFHRLLHTHHLSSGSGTTGQLMADVTSGLGVTPP